MLFSYKKGKLIFTFKKAASISSTFSAAVGVLPYSSVTQCFHPCMLPSGLRPMASKAILTATFLIQT